MRLHLGWALAALVAFGLGTVISSRSSTDDQSGDQTTDSRNSRLRADGMDTSAARSSLKREGDDAAGRGLINDLFGSYTAGAVGLDTLAEQAFRDPNPITRRLAFGQLLASMTPENAGQLREMLLTHGAEGAEWRDFNYSWGAIAGQEAFEFAAASKENDMAATMSGWAAANPTEAMAMLENLPENMAGSRTEIAEGLVSGLAARDLASATDLALRLGEDGTGQADRLIRAVAIEALRGGGPSEAALWAEGLPDGAAKGSAMNRIAGSFVREDPVAAAGWVERFAGEEYAARAVAEVGEEWGERDPTSAVGWLETLPSGKGQSDGFSSVLGDWEDRDPVAASEYLAQMPPSPQRDAAVSGFAQGYAWQDPQAAIAWAEDISDPSLREQSLTQAGQAYYRRDPENAKVWLESSGLSDESRNQVLNPQRRRR